MVDFHVFIQQPDLLEHHLYIVVQLAARQCLCSQHQACYHGGQTTQNIQLLAPPPTTSFNICQPRLQVRLLLYQPL